MRMRRHISILALMAGLVLSVAFVVPVAVVGFTIDELWFPGGTDSHWVYNTPDGGQITLTVVGGVDIGGRRYKAVKESEALIGAFTGADPDPFLVFRPDHPMPAIRGYGVIANGILQEDFRQTLAGAGLDKNVKLQFSDDEWNVVDLVEKEWTVMRIEAEVVFQGVKILGSFEIEGRLISFLEVETDAGVFEALLVDYVYISEIEGDVERVRFWSMWLAPGVGLVQLETGQGMYTLAEYDITPDDIVWTQGKDVADFGALPTTWAHLKQLR